MSRPYPVGEKGAVIIITMLAGCTKAVRTGKSRGQLPMHACALQDGLSKDPRRRVGL